MATGRVILEPVAWWQAYAEWYARPIPFAESAARIAAALEGVRLAFLAAMPRFAELAARIRELFPIEGVTE